MKIEELFQIGMDRQIPSILPFKEGLHLNLGAGNKQIANSVPLDYPEWDADGGQIPYEDGTVSGIHAYHFLEHLANPVSMLQEIQRVLVDGGLCNIVVPYYKSQMAYQDLDHKAWFTEETWKILFRNPYYDKNRIGWKLQVGTNIIIGLNERNLCLMTLLIKVA